MPRVHSEATTVQITAVRAECQTEPPRPYIPREPPPAETVLCHRCHRPMEVLRVKDAGWLRPIAAPPGCEDGEDILGYVCAHTDCLDGEFDV